MNKRFSGALLCTVLLLTACMAQQVRLDAPNIELARADVLPTGQELEATKHKVVIFPPDAQAQPLARDAGLGLSISTELAQYITQTASNLIDHTQANALAQEIQQLETTGAIAHEGPVVADFALTGTITNASVATTYYPPQNWTDKKGQVYKVHAKCTHSVKVAGVVKVHGTMPRLAHLQSIKLDHASTSTEETRSSDCTVTDAHKHELLTQAAQNAVKKARVGLQNLFAPQAYIIEAKQNGQNLIFKLSGGTDSGFNVDDELTIYTRQLMQNPLTGKDNLENIELTQGKVSSTLGSNYAWIIVEDWAGAHRIRLGDFVKVRYSKGFLEKVGGLID